jgi:hypothetical protein
MWRIARSSPPGCSADQFGIAGIKIGAHRAWAGRGGAGLGDPLGPVPLAALDGPVGAAARTIRPVKVQQRGSGGAWRTLDGLADFAIFESYLSTAAKWGIAKLDALRDLFNRNAWQPPGLEPAG